jgi:hypothetical protein
MDEVISAETILLLLEVNKSSSRSGEVTSDSEITIILRSFLAPANLSKHESFAANLDGDNNINGS